MRTQNRHTIKGFIQRLYITWDAFMVNDLFTYASAGAYSFFLSAFPLILMVLVILVRVVRASPEVITDQLASAGLLEGTLNLTPYLDSVRSLHSFGLFEVIVGFSIFWMARRFFASIQQGMTVIYRKRGKGKPIKENLVVLAGEALLVILIVLLAIFVIGGKAYFNSAVSHSLLSPVMGSIVRTVFRFAPLAIIFVFLFLVYLITPRTRPTPQQSLFASAACTVSFAVVQLVFTSFVNMSRYNLVYGIMSNVIVILLEVYLFFFLFLFFAQFQFVVQFFESFLLAQLYLLPSYSDPDPMRQIKRIMFIEPPRFYREYAVHMKKGEIIFGLGDESNELYYVWKGIVKLEMPNQILISGRGKVFGEFSSIAGGQRTASAIAETDVILLKIPARLFRETVEVDADLSARTLRMISDYVRKKNKVPLSTEL